jgi:hypothetical protein
MNALLSSYLQSLHVLKKEVEKGGNDDQVVSILQIRLKENIEKMRIQGDTPEIRADRMVILSTADEITERLFDISFDDFRQLYTHKKPSSETGDQPSMPLTPAESEALKAALLSAFPSPGDLQQVVAFKLGENLSVIAGGNNYGEIVFNLIVWTEAHGKTENLIVGARQMNPGNPRLRAFEEQYRMRDAR